MQATLYPSSYLTSTVDDVLSTADIAMHHSEQNPIQSERAAVSSSKGPSEATGNNRRGHARNGHNAPNGGTSSQTTAASTTQRHPSRSSMANEDDEPLPPGGQNHSSSAKGKERDLGQSSHAGHNDTAGPVGRGNTPSDSGGSQGSTLPAWRVPGYVPEHSQSPGAPRTGSVAPQYSVSALNGIASAEGNQQQRSQPAPRTARQGRRRTDRSDYASPTQAPPRQDAEMLTVLIHDHRYSDHGIAEIFVPTFRADGALWVDARDVVDQLQLSPGKVDGPARVYVMRGGWKQYFLRVEANGQTLSGLANLKVEEDSVLKINIDYIPQYAPHVNQHHAPPEQVSSIPRAEQGWSASSGATRMQAQPAPAHGQYHQQSHAQGQPRASAGHKRRYRSSGEDFDGIHETNTRGDVSDGSHIEHPPSGGESPALVARAFDTHAPLNSRPLTLHASVAPQIELASMTDDASSVSPRPASTPQSPASMRQSAGDFFGAKPVQRAPPETRSESPVETAVVRSPVPTEPAFSPAPLPVPSAPLPIPQALSPSPVLQSTPDSSPPRPQAKRQRYNDDSDSSLDMDPPRASLLQSSTTAAPAPASGFDAFSKFASAGTTSAFTSFSQQPTSFGVLSGASASTSTQRAVAQGPAAGMFPRMAGGFGTGPTTATDGVTLHLRTLLRAEPGYEAFLAARSVAQLCIAEQVAHWRYLKSKLDLYVGRPVPADVREAVGTTITKEQVARAFGVVPVTRTDEYVEALVLTGLYGPGGTREDARVVQMYHEPCPVSSNIQFGRYLVLLKDVHARWEAQHGSA